MKHVWTDTSTDKKAVIYGLYMRKSLFQKKLLCYFMDRREAIQTLEHLAWRKWRIAQYVVKPCKMPGRV